MADEIVTFEIPSRDAVEFELGELMPYWDKETLKGDKGDDGESATITIGTVTEGDTASVTNSGTSSAAVLDFVLPKGADGADGQDGADGAAATISIGTVSTGAAGSSVSVTNSGTSSAAVFNFTIPKGDTGAAGADGQDGQDGADGVSPTLTSSKSGKTTTIYYTDKTHTSGTDVLATIVDGTDGDTLPSQTGNSGKYLTTNGSTTSWATVSAGDSLPSQTGNSGKYLTTNGSTASWANTPTEIPTQTGNSGKFLTTNGSAVSWANAPTEIPSQSGNSGKYLTTNGSALSWATVSGGDSLPSQTGNSGKFLTTNGTAASWADVPKEIFLIELQYNSSTEVFSSTETYAEAKAAHDAGKILVVNAFGMYIVLADVDSGTGNNDGLIYFERALVGQVIGLTFHEDDSWDVDRTTTLPVVTSSDNGKFLQVSNGAWAAVTVPIYNGATS